MYRDIPVGGVLLACTLIVPAFLPKDSGNNPRDVGRWDVGDVGGKGKNNILKRRGEVRCTLGTPTLAVFFVCLCVCVFVYCFVVGLW